MSNQSDINHIVTDFQEGKVNQDYSHAIVDLAKLQKQDGEHWSADRDQINDKLKALGFKDFSIVGTDNTGHLITRGSDGKQQTLDTKGSNAEAKADDKTHTEKWGTHGREFKVNPDGSAQYQAKKGDRYWDVVKDALTQQNHGKPPSNTEIMNSIVATAKAEGKPMSAYNSLKPGQEVKIPKPSAGGEGHDKPKKPEKKQEKQPDQKPEKEAEMKDPLSVLNPPGGNSGDTNQSKLQESTTKDPKTGVETKHATGELNDHIIPSWLGGKGTKFDTSETHDRDGNLLSRDIKYPDGKDVLIADEQGNLRQMPNVSEIQTKFNSHTGNYETNITTKDGQHYTVESDKSGKTVKVGANVPQYGVLDPTMPKPPSFEGQ
jgi:hypothetical protein